MLNFSAHYTARLTGDGVATRYARHLLSSLGIAIQSQPGVEDPHPARRWADSGLMALTGNPGEVPLLCPVPLASQADGALDAFRALTNQGLLQGVRGADLLAERARLAGLQRQGAVSPGGSCHLLPTADGRIAITLARQPDWEMLAAWLQAEVSPHWEDVSEQVARHSTTQLLEQGHLLGLAIANANPPEGTAANWLALDQRGRTTSIARIAPRVLDLSSLWAGPLCSHLFQLAGATVIKVESTQRPDGARAGSPQFFGLLNQGKQSLALALHTSVGQGQLLDLIRQADIVIEGSRPRALRQMGIVAEDIVADRPGVTWLGINGYGRAEPMANRLAYGDDAAVAAGLSRIMHDVSGQWVFCADAIADPLTGLHAAVAGWASWMAGGGQLIDLSMHRVVAHCISWADGNLAPVRERHTLWQQHMEGTAIADKTLMCRRWVGNV